MPIPTPRPRIARPLMAAFALLLSGCGGSDESAGPGSGGSGLTAKFDGKAWEAEPISIVAQATPGVPGSVMILGTQNIGGKSHSLTITLYNIGGPGKYALGVGSSAFGGSGHWGEGTGSGADANTWITPGTGVAGEIEIASLGDGRITGTFQFACVPGKENTVGGTRTLTDGKYDLPFQGTLAPLAENAGSKVTAEMDGVFYNAETVDGGLTDFTGGAGVRFSSLSELHGLSINMVGVTDAGAFTLNNLSPQRLITAGRNGGTAENCCWGSMAADEGEIIVTSLTSKRVKGTFSATLKPQANKPATEDLVIRNGTFDIGIR